MACRCFGTSEMNVLCLRVHGNLGKLANTYDTCIVKEEGGGSGIFKLQCIFYTGLLRFDLYETVWLMCFCVFGYSFMSLFILVLFMVSPGTFGRFATRDTERGATQAGRRREDTDGTGSREEAPGEIGGGDSEEEGKGREAAGAETEGGAELASGT